MKGNWHQMGKIDWNPEEDTEDLGEMSESELARLRRRDHDHTAGARAPMSNGGAKRFKAVNDKIARRGREATSYLEQGR